MALTPQGRTVSISVVTATFNSAGSLPALIRSLEQQTDQDFEWIVKDNISSDGTQALVEAANVRKRMASAPDFGIYDALNGALRMASGDYYLVVGSDDMLEPETIARYRAAVLAETVEPDLVTASISAAGRISAARTGKAWLYGMRGHVSAHTMGVLIRRSLHDTHGYYSRRFPIAADHYFIVRAARAGARIKVCSFCAGTFGATGVSSTDVLGTLSEFLRVQIATGSNPALQLLLFFLRVLKNYRRLR